MSRPRNPIKLTNFPPIYEEVVRETIEKGSLCLDFHTEREAYSVKFDLSRYFHSLAHYRPDSELARLACRIKIKKEGERLELVDRENTLELGLVAKGLAASRAGKPQGTVDQAARDIAVLRSDPEMQDLFDKE